MIGETIGNFRLIKRLGSGGMGEVFLAEHKDLQTPVAVKLLNADISKNQEHCQRFFNEARVVSKIKHAGTVKIFDSGYVHDQAYLIMELLDGESLAGRISRVGKMSVAQTLDIARQIASVLDATHRQGVTHRDLKPDNIFIVHDDERASGERVKILDFGIAKLSGTLAGNTPKTQGTMGTPAYMAPEQWGDSSAVDWRADAYSLGCVIFEMVCGSPPFRAATIAEAFTQHYMETPPTPSTIVPGIPPQLDELILRLLAKKPEQRAASMGQVVRELAALAGEPMPARLPSEPGSATTPTPQPFMSPPGLSMPHPATAPAAGTATTLGGSVGQMHPASSRSKLGIVAGVALTAIAAVVTAVVITASRGNKAAPSTGSTATPASATAPAPTSGGADNDAALPPPSTTTSAPAPNTPSAPGSTTGSGSAVAPGPAQAGTAAGSAITQAPPATGTEGAATTAATKPVASTATKPKPRPTTKPTPKPTTKPTGGTGSGSAKPAPVDEGWGGRL